LHRDVLQQLLVSSDVYSDPQALILSPKCGLDFRRVDQGDSYVANAKNGALAALNLIEEALSSGK